MNNQHKILHLGFILAFFFLNGCSPSKSNNSTTDNTSKFKAFNHFPVSPFLDLNFNTSVITIKSDLESEGYSEHSEFIFSHKSDSTSIILVDDSQLTEFKLYLKSEFYLAHKEELFQELSGKSVKTIGTFKFSEMSFKTANNAFKLTYFTTDHSIRISYQLLKQHY